MSLIPRKRAINRYADEVAASEPYISDCQATPARVILHFDGYPDAAVANKPATYKVANTAQPHKEYEITSAEYDADSQTALFRNPVNNVGIGDWLQVIVSGLGSSGRDLRCFVRVQSELSLLADASPPRTRSAHGTPDRRRFELTPAWVVVSGLAALVILGALAMAFASTGEMQTIATAAFGVIGSVVGAFFGVHAGLGDRQRLELDRDLEATKGQMLAAMMPEDQRAAALDVLKEYSPPERARS
jgi:hypothetical protein